MTDKHSDLTAPEGQKAPGDMIDTTFDRLSAQLEASYDRVGAQFERAMRRLVWSSALLTALGMLIFVLVNVP